MKKTFELGSSRRCNAGLTLAELLLVLAIGALIAAAAAPGYTWLLENSRLVTRVNDLVADLHLVRSEALKRGAAVSLCRSADGASCSTSGTWTQEPGTGETRIRHQQPRSDRIRITLSAFGSSGNLSYYPSGMTFDRNGTFTFCTPGGAARAVIFSRTGRVRVARKKPDGSALACP